MSLRRYHLSQLPIERVEPTHPGSGPLPYKPGGFWYSVGDEWEEWCTSEDFGPPIEALFRYRFEVDLDRILRLTTADQVRRLGDRYAAPLVPGEHRLSWSAIDWAAIGGDYAGIEIAPYQWECRLSVPWYYPWDVASGCIWDPSAILRFDLDREPQPLVDARQPTG